MPCGSARGGIGAQVAQQGSQETQRGPLPPKHWGLKKTPALHSFLCCHLELGEWTKPKDSSSEHLQCPLSNTTYSITALTASTSVGGKTSVPKAPQGTP